MGGNTILNHPPLTAILTETKYSSQAAHLLDLPGYNAFETLDCLSFTMQMRSHSGSLKRCSVEVPFREPLLPSLATWTYVW